MYHHRPQQLTVAQLFLSRANGSQRILRICANAVQLFEGMVYITPLRLERFPALSQFFQHQFQLGLFAMAGIVEIEKLLDFGQGPAKAFTA
jgi:hypothetical protein